MTTLTPDHLLDLIARANRVTGIAVDDIGDGGMSLLRWMGQHRRVTVWADRDRVWHVEVGGVAYEGPTLLLATLRAVAGTSKGECDGDYAGIIEEGMDQQ